MSPFRPFHVLGAGQRPAPWRALAAAVLLAVLLHALLLGWVPVGFGDGFKGGVAPVMSVRQIVAPGPTTAALTKAARPTTAPRRSAPAPEATPEATPTVASTAPSTETASVASSPAVLEAPQPAPVAEAQPVAAAASEPAAIAASYEGGGQAVPTYVTHRAPAAVLRFELRRGGIAGSGEMVWRPTDSGYTLAMNGTVFGLPVLSWASQGGFDADGLAPERFVDQRRLRDVRAANFQRDKGRITYSGPSIEHPLLRGAQDRLSWMLQLPAVLQAEPAAYGPGARISMLVAGARGDADVWTFVVEAQESVDVIDGQVSGALRLLREPRKPYDTRVEVWLDPARWHLPVKLKLTQPNSGEGFEFTLRDMTLQPS